MTKTIRENITFAFTVSGLFLLLALFSFQLAGAESELLISSNKVSKAVVVVSPEAKPGPKSATRCEFQAANDLVKYIEMLSGAKPQLADTPESIDAALKDKVNPVLLVGSIAIQNNKGMESKLSGTAKKNPVLRADAIALQRQGNRIYLAGTNDESHYYAVSTLLQKWGCRWYMPTEFGECIPDTPTLTLGALDEAYAPPFEVRSYWISWCGDGTGAEEFKLRNFMTDRRVSVQSGHCLATYTKELIPPGKTCYNVPIADEETATHVAAKVADKYGKDERFSLGMEDGMYQSDSPKDKELMALQYDKYFMRPSMTDCFIAFYNNVARILREKYPQSNGKIGFLAYSNITLPPVKAEKSESSLVAYLAPIDIDPIHGMDDPQSPPRQEYRDMMYGWAKVMDGRVVIYDYDQGMLVWRDIPNPSLQGLEQDIRHYRKAGILGVDTESRNASGTIFINLYCRGQLLWNPDTKMDALLADFYPKFYGPAAESMAKYWNAIFEAWKNTIVTEHEYFVAPAIYTPELIGEMRKNLEAAEKAVIPLKAKSGIPTRNEKLYLDRMQFTRLSFSVTENYIAMVRAAGGDCDYAKAAVLGEKGLAAREGLTAMNNTFTTYQRKNSKSGMPETGPAWWPGEVQQYRDLQQYVDGSKGILIQKLPLEWAFHRDPKDLGLKDGWGLKAPELAFWKEKGANFTIDTRKDYPVTEWEMVRTDMYLQAQGIRNPDRQSYTGYGWYASEIELKPEQAKDAIRLMFPGLFNECWLYVNGKEAAHREKYNPIWWNNDYKFEWDVDLTGKLGSGKNLITLRIHNPHHFGGMFRRPFLYAPTGKK